MTTVLAPILDRTPVTRIEDVLSRMQEIDAALPRADGVACFNRLYLAVTTRVLQAEAHGGFHNPEFLARLDVAFGNLYFSALKANEIAAPDTPRAWRPLFAARERTDLAPIQFALAGMNAHINRDLAPGLVQTFAAMGLAPSASSPEWADYQRVNVLLADTEAAVKRDYFTPLLAELDRACGNVDDVVAMWCVGEARRAAWTNGEALWRLREHATLSA